MARDQREPHPDQLAAQSLGEALRAATPKRPSFLTVIRRRTLDAA